MSGRVIGAGLALLLLVGVVRWAGGWEHERTRDGAELAMRVDPMQIADDVRMRLRMQSR